MTDKEKVSVSSDFWANGNLVDTSHDWDLGRIQRDSKSEIRPCAPLESGAICGSFHKQSNFGRPGFIG